MDLQAFFDFLTANQFAQATAAFIFFLFAFWIFHAIILSRLEAFSKKTKTDIDDALIAIVRSIHPPFYTYLALYVGLRFLSLPDVLQKLIDITLIAVVVFQGVKIVDLLITYIIGKRFIEGERGGRSAASALSFVAKLLLWSFGFLFALSNLGVNITSLIAGLGIGGVAVALALQNILGDLFSSFAIYFDKPFIEGDFIIVGEKMGVVEKIGIKTTRVRALQGEELVMSNRDLTNATIQNFKKMRERRIVFGFGVAYETPPQKLREIPAAVKEAIDSEKMTRFDRANFSKFAESSLDYEVVYYLKSPDYNEYMRVQENINIKILEALTKAGVAMAYPTRTIYMRQ